MTKTKKVARPKRLSPEKAEQLRKDRAAGMLYKQLRGKYYVSDGTISHVLAYLGAYAK